MENSFVIITGANGGIGTALAEVYKDAGYKIIAIDRTPEKFNNSVDLFIQIDLVSFSQS
jgi:NADP-dependent 3-hydroxy acid dehydrogenase YdfG